MSGGDGLKQPPAPNPAAAIANVQTTVNIINTAVEELPFVHVVGESSYEDSVTGEIQANKIYPVFEALINGTDIEIYSYNLVDNDGDPDETTGRTLVATIDNNEGAMEIFDMTMFLNKAVTGMIDKFAGQEKVYFSFFQWDGTEWQFFPIGIDDGTGRQSNVIEVDFSLTFPDVAPAGDNIADLALKEDEVVTIYLNHISSEARIIAAFYSDTAVLDNIDVPWQLTVRRTETD